MKNIKFEYILTVLLVGIISAVIFLNINLTDTSQQGFTAIIGTLSGVTGFIFGIRQTDKTTDNK